MANIFLDANDSFTLPSTNTNDAIFGRAGGSETVILQGNPTGTTLDGNVEVVQVASAAANTTLQVNATTGRLELVSGGTVFATFSGGLNQAVNMQFTDGNVTLTQTGANAFTIATPGSTTGAVTINTTTSQTGSAVTLGAETSTADDTPVVAGQTIVLDATDTSVVGSAGDDTYDGSLANSLQGRSVVDIGGTDTLNATLTAALTSATSVIGVENVNLNLNFFTGSIDADDILGATITGSSSKLGFDGEFAVTNTGANNIVAGTNVTLLDVDGLTTGTVNAGSASTVEIDPDAATDSVTLIANGNATVVIAASTNWTFQNTAASVLDLTGSTAPTGTVTATGTGGLTLTDVATTLTGLTVVDSLTSGDLVIDVDTTANDGTDWAADLVNISGNIAAFTAADAQVVTLAATQTGLTLTGQSATTGTMTVNTGVNQTSVTLATLDSATYNVTAADTTTGTFVNGGADVTVNVAGDTTITTLTVAGGEDVTVTGTGDVTIGTTAADTVNASALTGLLDVTNTLATDVSISGGTGDNDVDFTGVTLVNSTVTYVGQSGDDTVASAATTGDFIATFAGGTNSITANSITTGTLSVTGGAGAETVSVAALTTGTVAGELGGGNDTVTLSGSVGAGTIAVDFGAGIDTLVLGASEDLTTATFSVVGLENITVDTDATFIGSQLTGGTFNISGTAGNETVDINATSTTGETIDLSGITLSNVVGANIDATVTGLAGGDTIIGTSIAETIDGDGSADVLTGNGGADVFLFDVGDTGITLATADTITDFTTQSDQIDFTGLAALVTTYAENDTAVADFAAALAAANAVFDGTFIYSFQHDATNGYLFFDNNADNAADEVVVLTGINADGIEFGDIIA